MAACWYWGVTAPTMTTRCLLSSFISFISFFHVTTITAITMFLLVDSHGWIPHKRVSTARAYAVEMPVYSVTAWIYIIIKTQKKVYTSPVHKENKMFIGLIFGKVTVWLHPLPWHFTVIHPNCNHYHNLNAHEVPYQQPAAEGAAGVHEIWHCNSYYEDHRLHSLTHSFIHSFNSNPLKGLRDLLDIEFVIIHYILY